MAGDFNIAGTKVPRNAVLISGAVAVGIIGYAYWSRRGTGITPADTGTTTGSDPNIDPSTGLPYADEYGYGSYGVPGYSGMGIYDPATGGTIGGGYGQVVTQLSTNAQWAQAAQLYLTTVGYEPTKSSAAIGKALTGQAMTDEEIAIFSAARGFEGEPPQGYPPIHHVPTTPGGTTNPTGKGPVTGLKATTTRTRIHLDWKSVPGAKGYSVDRDKDHIVTVNYSQASVNGSPGHSYKMKVTPVMSNGKLGTPAYVTARMKK